MLINLINNIAFLVALVAIGLIVLKRFHHDALNRQVLLGLLFGGVALLGMLNPVTFAPGLIFDGRSIVLSVAGVVGGVGAAAIAAGMAAIYRYQLGGIGATVGVMVVLVSAVLGVLASTGVLPYPSHAALMRHLLLHTAGNLCTRSVRLIQLIDIARLVPRLSRADWDEALAPDNNGAAAFDVPPARIVTSPPLRRSTAWSRLVGAK